LGTLINLAWFWHHFHLVWDEIRTHDLFIVNLVCYPLDQAFARWKIVSFKSLILRSNMTFQRHQNQTLEIKAALGQAFYTCIYCIVLHFQSWNYKTLQFSANRKIPIENSKCCSFQAGQCNSHSEAWSKWNNFPRKINISKLWCLL